MSVHTRTPRTKRAIKRRVIKPKKKTRERPIPWREAFKEEINRYGEGGLMLRGCRYKKALTQKEVADALEMSQNHISEMENGKRPIGKVMALRFAKFFKTDYRKFL